MASILPNGKTQFIDQNGKPLAYGTVTFYEPGTTTKKDTWQDSAMTQPNTNPVVLDSRGQATIWGSGSYRQVVADKFSAIIWDQVVSDLSGTLGDNNGSSLVGFIQSVSGAVKRTAQDKMREVRSLKDLPVASDASVDIGPLLQLLATAGGKWIMPAGRYLLDSAVTFGANDFHIEADDDAELVVTSRASIALNGKRCGWRGGKITSTVSSISGTTYLFNWATTSEDCYVENVFFSGNFSYFLQLQGIRPRANGNVFDPDNGVICISPIQMLSATNPQVIGNRMGEYDGFGIIARQDVKGGVIAYNHINPGVWSGAFTATAGQTVFTYNFGNTRVKRFGIVVNRQKVNYSVSQSGSTVTFTLSVGANAGDTVNVFAWISLENININLRARDVLVLGNHCENSGDGGIVVTDGSQSSGTDPDFLHGIKVIGNTVIGSAAAGIGIGGTYASVVADNVVRDCGYNVASPTSFTQISSVFMSGIYLPKQPGSTCTGNVIEVINGFTAYGVAFSLTGDTTYVSDRDTRHSVGGNHIRGVVVSRYWAFADSSATARQIGVDVFDLIYRDYPENIIETLVVNWDGTGGRPPDSAYWTGAAINGGIQKDTTHNTLAPACIATITNATNDFTPKFLQRFAYSFVRVIFRARATTGNSGFVTLFVRHASDPDSSPGATVNVTDTTEREYEIVMAVETILNMIIRVGGAATNGVIYITDMRVQYGRFGYVAD